CPRLDYRQPDQRDRLYPQVLVPGLRDDVDTLDAAAAAHRPGHDDVLEIHGADRLRLDPRRQPVDDRRASARTADRSHSTGDWGTGELCVPCLHADHGRADAAGRRDAGHVADGWGYRISGGAAAVRLALSETASDRLRPIQRLAVSRARGIRSAKPPSEN